MSLIIPANTLSSGGFAVDNSCRFDDGSSTQMYKTISSTSTTWTFSCWIKLNPTGTNQYLASWDMGGGESLGIGIEASTNQLFIYTTSTGQSPKLYDGKLRDPSAWMNIVIKNSSGTITSYINGTQAKTSITGTALASGTLRIGCWTGSNFFYDGYMSEVVLIDGTAYSADSFGEFDEDSGIWKPIDVSGLTFGSDGFYLDFENSGSLGADVSGNGNNFTVNNLTSIDQTTDTPTNNFATLNPLLKGANYPSFAQGNLQITSTGSIGCAFSTMAMTKGKWYWEIYLVANAYRNVGICDVTQANGLNYPGTSSLSWGYNVSNGRLENNSLNPTWSTGTSAGNTVNVALDMDNGKLFFGVNGTYLQSGNPVTGANPAVSNLLTLGSGEGFYFCDSVTDAPTQINQENFGNPPYTISSGNTDGNGYGNIEYAVPSGYLSLCTKNLSEVLG